MIRKAVLVAAAIALSGCVMEPTGPVRHESRSIERDTVERARVELRMGAGDLRVEGGTSRLAQADFTYNVPSWKPYVRYTSSAGRADLSIEQPGGSHGHAGGARYRWDVRLSDEVPIDLVVHFGAGDARLDLGTLAVRSAEVNMGVGRLEMDLRGNPKHDYDVQVRGGVGEATIRLPRDVGIFADARGGIGSIHSSGLHNESGHLVDDAYATAKVRIHVDVQGGIGEVRLIAD